jgi:manganese efflux pump family protein
VLEWGQMITLAMLAIALGMDAFSLGLGIGMQRLRYRKMIYLSLSIGLFHVVMPLLGMAIGQSISSLMKELAVILGGALLCFLGGKMIVQTNKEPELGLHSWLSLLLVSFSVSLDSLSVGLTLGLFATEQWIAASLFGGVGALMAAVGLWIGKFASGWLGNAGEAVGGLILIVLGLKFIW